MSRDIKSADGWSGEFDQIRESIEKSRSVMEGFAKWIWDNVVAKDVIPPRMPSEVSHGLAALDQELRAIAHSNDNQWVTILPVNTDSIATTYYKNMHSEYRDKLTTLMNIRLVIDTLQQKGYPFIMTFMDNLAFDTRWHTNTAILELQDYVRPHMTCFDGMNFLDWSKEQGYPIGTAAHPLEQAHAAAAEYMLQLGIHKV